MSASSLIFFVILAVWAAYMLKHWVRRRENLATARTVDRFSEAMRMLERRTPVKADLSARQKPGPNAILRPQVSVKGERSTDVQPASSSQPRTSLGAKALAGASRVRSAGGVRTSTSAATQTVKGAGRTVKSAGSSRLHSPKVKAGLLLSALAFFVVTAVLAPFSVVPAWLPLIGFVGVIGVVAWLRRSAIVTRQARAQRPSAPRQVVTRSSEAATQQASREEQAGSRQRSTVTASSGATRLEIVEGAVRPGSRAAATKRSPLVAEAVTVSEETESAEAVFDQEPRHDAAARAEAELFDNAAWAPVEVPRPTYTMKAKAERDEVVPAATVDSRPLAARYEHTPVDELPFDGMALDEDYDELPQVYRAG